MVVVGNTNWLENIASNPRRVVKAPLLLILKDVFDSDHYIPEKLVLEG
jgi:hypothetical protein